jgi:hypothetical protein
MDKQPSPPHEMLIDADLQEDRQLIDRILFLRSLATKSPEVDAMMEALIMVTGHWQPSRALSIRDRAAMDELETKLKTYLLEDDPAHAFTPQTLAVRLQEQANASTQLPKAPHRSFAALYATIALLIAILVIYTYLQIMQ